MPEPTASPLPLATADPPSQEAIRPVGDRAARGFAWTLAQNVIEKGIQSVGQLVLAWLLLPQSFKLVTLTYTVTTFATLLQQFGLRQVLVQRYAEFERWATPAFWMSLTLGLGAGLAAAAAAPAAAAYYNEPALSGLLMVAALALPVSSLGLVPEAKLSAQMRFRFFAQLGVTSTVLTFGLSVAFALMGLGAYSIILPAPIVALVRVALVWVSAGVTVRLSPNFSSWRPLVGDSGTMLLCSLAMMVTYQGHYSVLGRLTPGSDILGVYYIAYSLSDQATRTLMINLSGVLFPALSALQGEPARQAVGFLKAVRGLMLVGIPLCFLQGLVAGPVFRLLLPGPWSVGIVMFVIFSVAMLGRLVLGPCESMLLAQRRQRTWLLISVVYASGFLAATIAGTKLGYAFGPRIGAALGIGLGPAEGCAMGVALALNVVTPIALRACIAPAGGGWRDVWRDYRFPLLGSAAAAAAGWLAIAWLPRTPVGDAVALALGPLVMLAVYVPLVLRFARADLFDLAGRLRRVLPERIAAAVDRWIGRFDPAQGPEAEASGPAA